MGSGAAELAGASWISALAPLPNPFPPPVEASGLLWQVAVDEAHVAGKLLGVMVREVDEGADLHAVAPGGAAEDAEHDLVEVAGGPNLLRSLVPEKGGTALAVCAKLAIDTNASSEKAMALPSERTVIELGLRLRMGG